MNTQLIRQMTVATLVAIGLTLGLCHCEAASYIWNGGNGDWALAVNWTPDSGPPSVADTATINSGTVTVSTDTTVSNLNFSGGVIGGSAILNVTSNLVWTAGTMNGSGTTRLLAGASASLNGVTPMILDGNRHFENAGKVVWSGGIIGMGTGGSATTWTNLGTWEITDTAMRADTCGSAAVIVNEVGGIIRRTSGTGILGLAVPACGGSIALHNRGSLEVQSGTVELGAVGATAQHSGSFTVNAGTTLRFLGDGTQNITQPLNAAGTLEVIGSAVMLSGGLTAPTINVSGGSLSVPVQATLGTATLSGGALNFNGPGTVTNLTFSGGTLGGSGLVNVVNNLNWTAGTMNGSGTTRLLAGASASLNGVTPMILDGNRHFENAGTVVWSGGIIGMGYPGGATTWTNLGTWEITDNALRADTCGSAAVIVNEVGGIIRRTSGNGILGLAVPACGGSIALHNRGSLEVQSGTVELGAVGATAQHSGSFTVNAGTTLRFLGDGTQNITQPLNAAGTLEVIGSAVMLSGGLTAPTINVSGGSLSVLVRATVGTATLSGGALNFNGPSTVTNLTFSGGMLGGSGLVNVVNNLNWTAGTMNGSGTTRLLASALASLNGATPMILDGNRHFENAGTVVWSGGIIGMGYPGGATTWTNLGTWEITDNAVRADTCGSAAVMVNEGIIRRTGGSGILSLGLRPCGGQGTYLMLNKGLIEVQTGALEFGADFVQTSGSLLLNGGNVSAVSTIPIQGGSLSGTGTISASVTSSGIVSPGASPGLLTISGNYTQSTAGTLNIEINGMNPGTSFDRLAVTGWASLNGTNNIVVAGGFVASSGTKLKFLTAGVRSGTFSRFNYEFDYGHLLLSYPVDSGAGVDVELFITPLAINPPNASVPHGETQTFTASGGIPPYAFSFVANNSGGNIDGSGHYIAGSVARVSDTVKVTDFFGNNASATVSVLPDHYRVLGRVADASAAAIANATVTILSPINLTASTDEGGFYAFEQVPRGANITVSVSKPGYTFSPNQSFLVDNDKAADFTGTVLLRSISCIVTNSGGQGVSDARISILRNSTMVASRLTDANGQFTVNNLPADGTYQLVPSKLNATFSPPSRFVSLLQGNAVADFQIAESFIISGQVTDLLGNKVANATVRFQNIASTKPLAPATTGVGGDYNSPPLRPGTYAVRASKPGLVLTPENRMVSIVNADVPGQDFTVTDTLVSISGRVTNVSGASFAGVTVNLTGGSSLTTTTMSDGSYMFHVAGNGTYNITPSKAGLNFQPPSAAITPSDLNVSQSFRGVNLAPLQHTRIVVDDAIGVLWTMNGDGSDVVCLGQPLGSPRHPDLSRDGLKIAFTSYGYTEGLFVANADGSEAKQLLDDWVVGAPAWSPDGSKLSFVVLDYVVPNRAQHTLKVMNVSGSQSPETVRVLETYVALGRFSWSPDGTQLIGTDYPNLVRIPVNGTDETRIANVYSESALSPDGSKVAFVEWYGDHMDIFLVNTNGTGRQRLTFLEGFCSSPTWSPDGSMIAFSYSDYMNAREGLLYTMMADGSLQTVIGFGGRPTWGPEPAVATSSGSNVSVTNGAATLTFSSVSSPGTTTVVPTLPPLRDFPPGYVYIAWGISGGYAMAYEVTTTAGHSGPIQLCFTVPGINDAAIFNSLQVLHGENGVLVDRTVWRDFATRIICAQVSSLSPFTIAMKVDTNLPIVTGLVVGEAGHPIPDVTLELGPANSRQTITSIAGQFAFANLQSGSNYTILPLDDRFDFTPPLVVIENATGTNLIAFIAVPKPIPSLTILPDLPVSGYITLMWPADSRSYVLESTDSLSTPGWTMRPETPALEDDTFKVSLAVSGERRFFRLRSQ